MASPRICLLPQQCLDRADLGTSLLPASNHPPTSFPVTTFRTTSAILSLRNQPTPFLFLFYLNSYFRTTVSSQIGQNYYTEVEAAATHLANLHLQASRTYLPLGFYFNQDNVALEGAGHFFHELAKTFKGAECLLKMQTSTWSCSLPERAEAFTGSVGKTQDAMEAALALERSLNQALLELQALGSTHTDPQLRDFLKNHFLGE
uniref:Ferritin n=1 Tax=Myotis lucifugus TaxID=59463 RepID=G1QF74_MYOLU